MSTGESPEQKLERLKRALETGEGQTIEFKEGFPDQARDLAKEGAAFATSNTGTIYLGVTDGGKVVGIEEAEADLLCDRVTGVCRDNVKPTLRSRIDLIRHPDGLVMEIIVPKGPEPVYYCGYRPYLRDNRMSRPAESNEVKELHEEHFRAKQLQPTATDAELSEADRAKSEFISLALTTAAAVMGEWESAELRRIKPYIEELQYTLDYLGQEARRLAGETVSEEFPPLRELLTDLGARLAEAGKHRWYIGRECWDEWLAKGQDATDVAERIISYYRDSFSLPEDQKAVVLSTVSELASQVRHQWSEHDHALVTGNLARLKTTLGSIGGDLAKYGHLLDLWEDSDIGALREKIIELSHKLRQIETAYRQQPYETIGDEAAALASEIKENVNDIRQAIPRT